VLWTVSKTQILPNNTHVPTGLHFTLNARLLNGVDLTGDIPSDLPDGKGPKGSTPNQWYRFIIPMFYHAGLVHLAFNMFIQVWLGGDIEREIGPIRFMIVYFCSGIFGFVLGGNLGSRGQPSV
jgi:membrane associated rhomboid family serine protease